MDDPIEEVAGLRESGQRAALASLIWSGGSIPMSQRAKMLVRENGGLSGTIGGGCLEAELLAVGREVIARGTPEVTTYTMTEKRAGESGLNCGGTVRIFTEPVSGQSGGEEYGAVLRARRERNGCVVATSLAVGRPADARQGRMVWLEDGGRRGSLGSDEADRLIIDRILEARESETGMLVELELEPADRASLGFAPDERAEVFVEPFFPAPSLFIFGGGHVGSQICRLATNVGFRVVLIDDRPAFADPARHPDADECVVAEMDRVFDELDLDDRSYIVAVTRGHQHDEAVVEQAVRTPARYVGMMGSERKKMVVWKRLEERGTSRQRLDRVHAPIGVNVGADTPEEIAVSVVAELIRVRRGGRKTWKTKTVEASV